MDLRTRNRRVLSWSLRLAAACLLAASPAPAAASTESPQDPYASPKAVDLNPDPRVFETKIVAEHGTFDLGDGTTAKGMTYNGTVPGPRIEVETGTQVVVHFYNEMHHPSAIHWHGIELNNQSDGTGVSQNAVPHGGYFRYQFVVTRPGIFWYHPHHSPTNPAFQGQYAMLLVDEPAERALAAEGVLPGDEDTHAITLSDTTVCKAPGSNDTETWPGHRVSPTPRELCETKARDDHGKPRGAFAAGDIPNIQPDRQCTLGCWVNPGQKVLTNGRVASRRAGSPAAPGALEPGHEALPVEAGAGVRLRLLAATTFRYLRLRLTDATGRQVPLLRVGGEGGLLDEAILEGGRPGGFDTKFEEGEILLAPADRADVVFAVPAEADGVLTLWTQDFRQLGGAGFGTPTVPVMHFEVAGTAAERFSIAPGDPLLTHPAVDDPTEDVRLWEGLDVLQDPGTFTPPKPGTTNSQLKLNTAPPNALPAMDGIAAEHDHLEGDYTEAPFEVSTRYMRQQDKIELRITNTDGTHHPFHQHGFSFQPIAFEAPDDSGAIRYGFPYREFVDNIDIPPRTTLRLRFEVEDRPLADGVTGGGAAGRWLLHCHIFPHASLGMMAEFVVLGEHNTLPPAITTDDPFVDVRADQTAAATGEVEDPDRDPVTLSANLGTVTAEDGGRWSWAMEGTRGRDDSGTVIITATDANGARGQVAFDLRDDEQAPVTTHATTPAAPDGEQGWFRTGPVRVALAAEDGPRGSGVDRTEFSVDGGPFERYTAPFGLSGTGAHAVDFRSIDHRGNVEQTRSVTIRIDGEAATTSPSLSPSSPDGPLGAFYTRGVTVRLTADDQPGGSGVARTQYQVDGGAPRDYDEPFTVNANGEHVVTFRSYDRAGNVEAAGSVKWTRVSLDDRPPTTTHSLDPAQPGGGASAVTVTLSADDGLAGSGVAATEYRIGDGPWQDYRGPFAVAGEGEQRVAYRSTDRAGSVEEIRRVVIRADGPA